MQSTVNGQKSTVQSGSSLGARPFTLRPHQLEFLAQVVTPALQSERDYGIPACITIAQAILESAAKVAVDSQRSKVESSSSSTLNLRPSTSFQWQWGGSILFREANNPFGIKCVHFVETPRRGVSPPQTAQRAVSTGAPSEDYTEFDADTWEVANGKIEHQRAAFQRFPDLGSAFRAHAGLFVNSPRYKPAIQALRSSELGVGSPPETPTPNPELRTPAWQRFAVAIMNCGYSTDRPELCKQPGCPHYAGKLMKLVDEYRLNDPRALQWYAEGKDPKEGEFGVGSSELGGKPETRTPNPEPRG